MKLAEWERHALQRTRDNIIEDGARDPNAIAAIDRVLNTDLQSVAATHILRAIQSLLNSDLPAGDLRRELANLIVQYGARQ